MKHLDPYLRADFVTGTGSYALGFTALIILSVIGTIAVAMLPRKQQYIYSESEIYDGIIIGAGHNSLVLQAYLGKAGLKILCIERSGVAGGGLSTIEDPKHPGFFHNIHSFYHRALNQMPWYKDLELERHGAIYIEPDFNAALLLENGESLEWWTNFEKTAEAFARFSKKDAQTLRNWRDRFLPIVEKILIPEGQSPPIPPGQRRILLEKKRRRKIVIGNKCTFSFGICITGI